MRLAHLILLLLAAAVRADVPRDDAARGQTGDIEAERFRGVWVVVEIGFQGGALPGMPEMRLEFKGDRMLVHEGGKAGPAQEFQVKLHAGGNPSAIDFLPQRPGEPIVPAIYAFEGDTLRLCLGEGPRKERPKGFADKKNAEAITFVLKRPKK